MRLKPPTFEPPRVEIDANLAWVLRAAFADDPSAAPAPDWRQALQIARSTQLAGRVAARLGVGRGDSPAGSPFREDYYANVAQEALLVQAQEQIVGLAERLGVAVIAVKFAALRSAGVLTVGARAVSDVDILVPKASARAFWLALLAAGFKKTNTHEYPHQLEALVDPFGAFIDVHVHLPGVVVERGSFAMAEQLIELGLVTRKGRGILVPHAPVLAAHAIVHALVQNRSTPQTYSSLRMLSDLIDLRRLEPNVVQRAASYLAPEHHEVSHTVDRLCADLSNGLFEGAPFDGTSQQTLLWHCLAGRLNFAYAERLRAGGLANKLRDGSSATEIVRYIADLVYPSATALDTLYGPATGALARVRRRLYRPIDLVVRAARRSLRSGAEQ
jgi:hypothetical protein